MVPLIIGGVLLAILAILILIFITKYRTVGPDEALIVTGSGLGSGKNVVTTDDGKKIKIIRGGGTFVVPIMQQAEPLSLLNYKLEVGTRDTYTKQGVPVTVNGVSIIKVGSTIEEVSTAAEQYLGKETEELKVEAKEVLEGHLRAILSSMTVEDAYSNREQFAQKVHEVASTDLKKMGLRIVSFTIKEISDKNGYLDALGQPQIATVKRDAQIANAEREKEARIEKARAEKEAKEAEYQRDAQIAEAEKYKELKVQAYKKEQEQARADADLSYELQQAKAQQGVTEEQMRVKIIERERQIELEEKEIARREKQYDAEVKKKADADRYAVEQAAEAEKVKQIKKADAEQYKIEAEARARAEEVRVEGLAKAEIQKAQGTAEADVIKLKGLAEAEAKQKIAEAFEQYGQAAIMDMVLKMLPSYAKEIASPLSNIDKITVVDTGGGGKNSGAGKVAGYATDLMATMQETLKASSGIDLKELLESFAGKSTTQQPVSEKSVVQVGEESKKENSEQ
ncbi:MULTISPECIES: flotillin family protein [unclassified Bacillus (in: firmicutes)]|uniref:flotillin family protein n=1 Tax=unclassified Bacillus (in: firmicutes) TaxID=185979 RepID=UPI0008DEFC9C|nr:MULTISPECIES: flotillin family protein [unclassified Bacillus (in: firmicutes)]SFJ86035.1 flotillin [Bacillus sp. 71mf]SFT06028.1 flotillin [Bacillus sp. 103mf]